MTDGDLKQIRKVIKEESESSIEPVKIILEKHTKKLDALWDQTVEITEDITEIKITLKSHTADLDHTKKRITVIEDHLGL